VRFANMEGSHDSGPACRIARVLPASVTFTAAQSKKTTKTGTYLVLNVHQGLCLCEITRKHKNGLIQSFDTSESEGLQRNQRGPRCEHASLHSASSRAALFQWMHGAMRRSRLRLRPLTFDFHLTQIAFIESSRSSSKVICLQDKTLKISSCRRINEATISFLLAQRNHNSREP
jgi:hypothetical protein